MNPWQSAGAVVFRRLARAVAPLIFTLPFLTGVFAQETAKPVPVVVLMGPPAAGKSTQAALLQKHYQFAMITREQLMQDDPALLARYKQPDIRGVEPRIDPALNKLFVRRLEQTDISSGLLLDGYPAAKAHADFLRDLAAQKHWSSPVILRLDIPDAIVRQRLKAQFPEQTEQDLKDYHREFDFVSIYYPQANIVTIDGNQPQQAVFEKIREALDARLPK